MTLCHNGTEGLTLQGCTGVELVSSIVADNRQRQVAILGSPTGTYGDFNVFHGTIHERAHSLAKWQELTGSDAQSLYAEPDFVDVRNGDFRLVSASSLRTAGRYGECAGAQAVARSRERARETIEHVEVVSTTPTTANLVWWTPRRMEGTAVEWGPTARYGNRYDQSERGTGEYETLHAVTLMGLKPGQTYQYRVGCRERWTEGNPFVWDETRTFTTASGQPPGRRLYVSLKGDDRNNGLSPETAWGTLHHASRVAHAGDTVTIAPGRYEELLRPLQSGTDEQHRITYRADRPLSVFLSGGFVLRGGDTVRDGRPHCVQLHGKAFITLENLVFTEVDAHDYGGYRGGSGYGGLVRLSGSAGIEIKNGVFDGRYRWCTGLVGFHAGKMPGLSQDVPAATITDSAFLSCWYAVKGCSTGPLVFRNDVFFWNLQGVLGPYGGEGKWVVRNCVLEEIAKEDYALIKGNAKILDSDYNLVYANPDSAIYPDRWMFGHGTNRVSLKGWQEQYGQDRHSRLGGPGYPASHRLNISKRLPSKDRAPKDRPIRIEDFVPAADSPCRGAGENGEDVGVRWETWLR
ncbi:MAG: fibronectin type III domain-containing protein [Kiritimatiellae bacterium]|nr:fibronectin type III domain-containing protein [Kiritimatiellia bacterium]